MSRTHPAVPLFINKRGNIRQASRIFISDHSLPSKEKAGVRISFVNHPEVTFSLTFGGSPEKVNSFSTEYIHRFSLITTW